MTTPDKLDAEIYAEALETDDGDRQPSPVTAFGG
jgi:hypothetical protein